MDAKEALRISMNMGNYVATAYLEDLSDADLLHRPAPGCNHINWQLGHLIASSGHHMSKISPAAVMPLPAGFAEKYSAATSGVDDPARLCSKAELADLFRRQHEHALKVLAELPDSELDRNSGLEYAPTVASLLSMEGSHVLMHAGQWAVIRRQLGRKPLF
ncbi:MAG: DinB family protein [Planctomycetes bacterium]|nr:DinB family protein [Planctomycetota bacterium]